MGRREESRLAMQSVVVITGFCVDVHVNRGRSSDKFCDRRLMFVTVKGELARETDRHYIREAMWRR